MPSISAPNRRANRLHVDENGNLRKGPPLPLPILLDGVHDTATGRAFVNAVGNESQISTAVTGLGTLSRLGDNELSFAAAASEPVDNGLHFGHVLNDPNGELDESELMGIAQYMPTQAIMNLTYAPWTPEGSLFTSALPPPPGAAADAGGDSAFARAPGGGVAPRDALLATGAGPTGTGRMTGVGRTAFDVGRVDVAEERRLREMAPSSAGRREISSVTNRLARASARSAEGGWNPLEMMSTQAASVLKDAGTYAIKKGGQALYNHAVHYAKRGYDKLHSLTGASKKIHKKRKERKAKAKSAMSKKKLDRRGRA